MQTLENRHSEIPVEWPADVRAVFESIETAFPPMLQRRRLPRTVYKHEGRLLLDGEAQGFAVYTRDVNMWTVGLIAGRRLVSHMRGLLTLAGPDGVERELRCRVVRVTEIRPGWFDVGMEFGKDEAFAEERILG